MCTLSYTCKNTKDVQCTKTVSCSLFHILVGHLLQEINSFSMTDGKRNTVSWVHGCVRLKSLPR